ncbi:MAG TPA: hypothetical protein VM686_38820, partial [Polyangiaceae bacterium]|nr:hypothetical protein [Polyangiaceae bacterium]
GCSGSTTPPGPAGSAGNTGSGGSAGSGGGSSGSSGSGGGASLLLDGAPCTVADACASGACTGGVCTPAGTSGSGGGAGTDAGGSGGMSGSGGSAGGAGENLKTGQSAGCGMQKLEPPGDYVEHPITVTGVDAVEYPDDVNRRYFTKIPEGYTEGTPWPLVFYGPGCGGSGNSEGTPLDGAIAGKAILVFLSYTDGCFKTGGGAASPEIPYFEQVLNEIEANYCVDKSKIFVSGYSSGGWLTNLLSCTHSDRIRGIGTAAGGLGSSHPPCVDSGVAAIMHAGTMDDANPIVNIDEDSGIDEGSGAARDRLLMLNGCDMTSANWDPQWGFCSLYSGCDNGNDVVWCEEDTGHSNGGSVSAQGWWKFWSALP